MFIRSVLLLSSLAAIASCQDAKSPTLTPEERDLAAQAKNLNDEGVKLHREGRFALGAERLRKSLDLHQAVYPKSKFPDGHPDLAAVINNLGLVLQAMGRAEEALDYYKQSYAMKTKIFAAGDPEGQVDIAISLNNLGHVLESMGQAEAALEYYKQSLKIRQQLYPTSKYPNGHHSLSLTFNNLGSVLHGMGKSEAALEYLKQSLEMNQRLYPATKYPDGHVDLALSLNNLGGVLKAMGQAEAAVVYFKQCLQMWQKLFPSSTYPEGHPDIALTLHNLGGVLKVVGQNDPALKHYQLSLEMRRKLYPRDKFPNGHPDLASSLNGTGNMLATLGRTDDALDYCKQSLEMRQRLYPAERYPDGHPSVAVSLNGMGYMLRKLDRLEPALLYYEQGLAMIRNLYPPKRFPDGHPHIAIVLSNVGLLLQSSGRGDEAVKHYAEALEMQQRLNRRELVTASQEAAFDKIDNQLLYRDVYLSAAHAAEVDAEQTLKLIWPARALVTRLLEQRQANIRAAGTAAGAMLDEWRGHRRRLEQLLRDVRMKKDDRDKLLAEYADKCDSLERKLLASIPTLQRWRELDKLGPADLVRSLPANAVFIDVIRYEHLEYVEKKETRTPRYVAYLLAKDRPIRRVNLADAKPIDEAIATWRVAIEARRDHASASILKERIWDILAPHVPGGVKTIYLAADGDLARLPWAALPISKERVLLEDYALSVVPHGTFLLDQLKFGKPVEGPQSVLTLGGIDYGKGNWPALPGAELEAKAIAALAAGRRETLDGRNATPANLIASAPRARYIHIATHGEFKADALISERKNAEESLKFRQLGDEARKVAAKNPLGYVGLVLSNGDVFSGLRIVDLPLKNTQLVTLSACETGLGDYTAGEGVQGLQRAFHLAGCPNVVASLWKVNDAATAALMAKFYHELWVNKKPPIEALREAQLTIYRHPELIPDLAGERGAPKLKEAIAVKPAVRSDKTADTKLWAAFVLSGVGN